MGFFWMVFFCNAEFSKEFVPFQKGGVLESSKTLNFPRTRAYREMIENAGFSKMFLFGAKGGVLACFLLRSAGFSREFSANSKRCWVENATFSRTTCVRFSAAKRSKNWWIFQDLFQGGVARKV